VKKTEVVPSEAEFHDCFGHIGVTVTHQHILQILKKVFGELPHTAHFLNEQVVYNHGMHDVTVVWESLCSTLPVTFDLVYDKTVELLQLLQRFDGSNFRSLKMDITLLLAQVSSEQITIHNLAVMCCWH